MIILQKRAILKLAAAAVFFITVFSRAETADTLLTQSEKLPESADSVKSISESPVVPDSAKSIKQANAIQEEDLLIIEDGSEEDILLEAVVPVKPAPVLEIKNTDSSMVKSVVDSGVSTNAQESASSNKSISAESPKTSEIALKKPKAEIIEERSINFARNQKEYRSPRLAMFLSLMVPGLGQVYTKKYARTVAYGLVEAAIIGIGVNVRLKGKKLGEAARDTADAYFSASKFWNFYSELDSFLVMLGPSVTADSGVANIKRDALWDSASFAVDAGKKNNNYYSSIADDGEAGLVQGWTDCEPSLHVGASADESGYILDSSGYAYKYTEASSDTVWLVTRFSKNNPSDTNNLDDYIWGYSAKQREYSSMQSEAENYNKISSGIFFSLIANHVISAIDAMITAKVHNDKMLGKETWLERINLNQQVAFDDGGIRSTFELTVRF